MKSFPLRFFGRIGIKDSVVGNGDKNYKIKEPRMYTYESINTGCLRLPKPIFFSPFFWNGRSRRLRKHIGNRPQEIQIFLSWSPSASPFRPLPYLEAGPIFEKLSSRHNFEMIYLKTENAESVDSNQQFKICQILLKILAPKVGGRSPPLLPSIKF